MTPPPEKPRRLGRGLEALLAATATSRAPAGVSGEAKTAEPERAASELQRLAIAQIRPNPYQPRKEFRAEELADLESSLKATGLLQPITVRPAASGYELIAGERRLRAATNLGWTEIPAIVRDIDDRTLLTLAIVENLQRVDLNPLEEAEGYQRLVDEFGLTQQQVADVVGKDRSTVANMLRLLGLPAAVRRLMLDGQLTLGHARALLALGNERGITDLAREVVARGLSVREVEARVREGGGRTKPSAGKKARPERDERPAEARRIESELRRHLQTDVQLTLTARDKGAITIQFYSAEDLERLLELMGPARPFDE
ncbi:MAG TPA: ParB/RepB/Spo0J family partition protein [Gemmatimonadaceae bacterium]|jgi:ParB family chromosome partitioning protein|nr:ParB/RepB/Spo0J family partition protein [Gemmatimonadaceae bacterium]